MIDLSHDVFVYCLEARQIEPIPVFALRGEIPTSFQAGVRKTRVGFLHFWTAKRSGNESNRDVWEKWYWWQSVRNTTQRGVEASTSHAKGWRVSDSAMGIVLKALRLVLGALKLLGFMDKDIGDREHEKRRTS